MSKIEKMIKELCPNGVEWKALWEVTIWDKKFNSVDKNKQPNVNPFKYLFAKDLNELIRSDGDVKILTTSRTNIYTTEMAVNGDFYEDEIVAIPGGGNPIVQYYNGKFVTSDNRIAKVNNKDELSTKFLYYYLLNNMELLASFYRGSGIKHPNMSKVLDLQIPIPPLEIQEELVKVLDTLTDLTAELSKEIELRQKQYEYYRDKLLTFEDVSGKG